MKYYNIRHNFNIKHGCYPILSILEFTNKLYFSYFYVTIFSKT